MVIVTGYRIISSYKYKLISIICFMYLQAKKNWIKIKYRTTLR